ncbi:hypothetical protein [Bradyrhizobium retamae]|uniref:Uncharacterized protein n=1 Tax=Bradyrhizobium retamae TaxID=1300035 RepID=A0A0R3N9L3_9BRAD|nr:hypothetical protein [Bradyrhizobium retamae]KRR29112.1 hypothetical protein CQ13_18405 [Bradyrhizobium retamae]
MSWVSYYGDITERQVQNGARVIFENYTHLARHNNNNKLSPKGKELAETAEFLEMSREKFIALRQWMQEISKTSRERLAQEETLVYALNESRDRVLAAQYVSTGEAAEISRAVPGDLLSLDDSYGGLLVSGRYVFVSDLVVQEGLRKYEPDDALLNGLITERLAA